MIESKNPQGVFLNEYEYTIKPHREKVFLLPIAPDQEKQVEEWKKAYPDSVVTFEQSRIKIKDYL